MAYIGREPQIGNFQICDAISTVNNQAAYTLQVGGANVSPETVNNMIVSVNGVIQKPGVSYTVAGSTITFTSALVTGDVIDFIQILGSVLDLGTPSDNTVTTAKIVDGAVTAAKLADGAVTGAKVISGMPVKFTRVPVVPVNFSSTAFLPRDNTVPLINEGGQVLQYDYTPALSSSTIMIWTHFHMAEVANVGNAFAGALFVNNTCVNVRATTGMSASGDGDAAHIFLETQFSNSDGSAVDIEIRADSANNYSINPQHLSTANDAAYTVAGSSFGGTDAINGTYLFIMEIK